MAMSLKIIVLINTQRKADQLESGTGGYCGT